MTLNLIFRLGNRYFGSDFSVFEFGFGIPDFLHSPTWCSKEGRGWVFFWGGGCGRDMNINLKKIVKRDNRGGAVIFCSFGSRY